MTERDLDIDFDFFDEPETAETVEAQRVPRRGGQGPPPPEPPDRPPTSLMPLLRLVGLIAFVIFLIVVLVFWVQSCQGASKQKKYSSYMGQVTVIGKSSARLGKTMETKVTEPGIKLADLESDLRGLARQQQQLVEQGQAMKPPGPLRQIHQNMIESLQFRTSGLVGLADAFAREGSTKKIVTGAGKRIAAQTQRFVAGDVIWADLFKTPAQKELEDQGVTGVPVPSSVFVQNPALTTSRTMISILERLRGVTTTPTTGTGLHGSGLEGVKVLPSGKTLEPPPAETTVNSSEDLAFQVSVKNTGDFVESHIPVKLTIQQATPIKLTKQIDLIEPGQVATVTFKDNFGAQVSFGELVTIQVVVEAVKGEKRLVNNSAEYKVIFSIPPK